MDQTEENQGAGSALTGEEEALLREFEEERARQKGEAAAEETPWKTAETQTTTDMNELRRMMEEEIREKLEAELRARIEEQMREELSDKIRKEVEPEIRKQVEAELRAKYEDLMSQVEGMEADVAGREAEMRRKIEAELETKLRSEIELEKNKKHEELVKKLEKIESIELRTHQLSEQELRNQLREDIKREIEEERQRKKAELLKKIETNQRANTSLEMQKEKIRQEQQKQGAAVISHTEKLVLLRLFEDTQKILRELMGSYLTAKKVEHIFNSSLESSEKKNPKVLAKAALDKDGNAKHDGSIEVARVLANVNALDMSEEKKSMVFFSALQNIFDERITAVETAIDLDTKEKIVSELLNRVNRIFGKNEYNKKMGAYFMDYIVPDTSLPAREK